MGGGQEAAGREVGEQAVEAGLGGQVEGWGAALEAAGGQALPDRAAELDPGLPQQPDVEAGSGEAGGDGGGGVGEQAEDADDRGRVDGPARRLVVEADVAPGHRQPEGAAGGGHPVHGGRERPHHLGPLGAGEVEAVGDRDRLGAGAGDVAGRLGDGQCGPGGRVEGGVAAVAVGGQGDRRAGPGDPEHGRVAAGPGHGPVAHVAVVLLPHPALGGAGRVGGQGEHGLGRVRVQRDLGPGGRRRRRDERPGVHRPVVGQAGRRHLGHHLPPEPHPQRTLPRSSRPGRWPGSPSGGRPRARRGAAPGRPGPACAPGTPRPAPPRPPSTARAGARRPGRPPCPSRPWPRPRRPRS